MPKKVFSDFDNSIRNLDGTDIIPQHERIKKHITNGDKVTVITRRHKDDVHSGFDGEDVKKYIKEKFGDIPVIFDDSDLKWQTLEKEGADMHYDDDKKEIQAINDNTDIQGILVKDGKGVNIKSNISSNTNTDIKSNIDFIKKDDNDLSTKIALVYDTGLNIEFACRLAQDFKKVYFFADYEGHQFENTNEMEVGLIGTGLGKVEKIYDFYKVKHEVDLFVFPDCKYAGMQIDLEKQGKRVWGGRNGIEFETERFDTKEKMKDMGMPIKKFWKIIGMDKFKEFLKSHENVFIKTDVSRGDYESFHHENYYLTEPRLNKMQAKMGPIADIYEFIAEEPVPDAVEAGYDGYCIDGEYPDECMVGYEIKDSFYCGTIKKHKDLSPLITDTTKAFSPLFKKEHYRSFFSTETRIKDKVGYTIDLTARIPSPPGDIYFINMENFSEVIWYGAAGILVQPKFKCKFSAEVIIHSSSCLDGDWEALQFPAKYKKNIRIKNQYYSKEKDTYYCIPLYEGLGEVGSVSFIDDDFEKCLKGLKDVADSIKGTSIHINIGDAEKAKKTIEEGEKIGIKFF